MLEIGIVVLLTAILVALALPNLMGARVHNQAMSCVENLKMIQRAKMQWAVINRKGSTDTPTTADVTGNAGDNSLKAMPICPAGGTYVVGDMTTAPTCSLSAKGHALPNQQ